MMIEPHIPSFITVHLGAPDAAAANVTLPFPEYIKNVASSEIYPTWPAGALRANIYALTSFALSRVYTGHYRAKGYMFDITALARYDLAFVPGREIFDNVAALADAIFTQYLRRRGTAAPPDDTAPLFAQCCNGVTVTGAGLSQWGSVTLAQQGYTPLQILRHYFGDEIEIVTDVQVHGVTTSYPGRPLCFGDEGEAVHMLQTQLNRISYQYTDIPKIHPMDGIFGEGTAEAVRAFRRLCGMEAAAAPHGAKAHGAAGGAQGEAAQDAAANGGMCQNAKAAEGAAGSGRTIHTIEGADGLPPTRAAADSVDSATWYRIAYLYAAVCRLGELATERLSLEHVPREYAAALRLGSGGDNVKVLQFYLAVAADFYPTIPPLPVTGYFDEQTEAAVRGLQTTFNRTPDGIADFRTWELLRRVYHSIAAKAGLPRCAVEPYPGNVLRAGAAGTAVTILQQYLTCIAGAYPAVPAPVLTGMFDAATADTVRAFQRVFDLTINGIVGPVTWDRMAGVYADVKLGQYTRPE